MTEPDQPKAVVVDDEPSIVELICDVLEDAGVETTPCFHGYRAFPCIQRERPQLVILDVQMPGVDGIQVFQRMRDDPETADIPVIFFTANVHILEDRLPDYAQQGAVLLPKPFQVVAMIKAVHQALGL